MCHLAILSNRVFETFAGVIAAQADAANRSDERLQIHRAAEPRDQGHCDEGEKHGGHDRVHAPRDFRE